MTLYTHKSSKKKKNDKVELAICTENIDPLVVVVVVNPVAVTLAVITDAVASYEWSCMLKGYPLSCFVSAKLENVNEIFTHQ
jgi:hypothetical protein